MTRIAVLGTSGWIGSAVIAHLSRVYPSVEVTAPRRIEIEGVSPAALRDQLHPDRTLSIINALGVTGGKDDDDVIRANVTFVECLVDALRDTDSHLVQIGSASEYGDPGSNFPIQESSTPRPLTVYGQSKSAATALVRERDDWVVLRPFNCVDYDMPLRNPIRQVREKIWAARERGGEVELMSAATARDHISRAFLVRSLAHAALNRSSGTFNLCSGVALTYREITESMIEVSGGKLPIRDLRRDAGIPAVIGDPSAWSQEAGLSERLSAHMVAELVMLGAAA